MTQITVNAPSNNYYNASGQKGFVADNGNLWYAFGNPNTTTIHWFYSTNKGSSWTEDTTGGLSIDNYPIFGAVANIAGKVWVLHADVQNPYLLWFTWGTINAGRTALTWSGHQSLWVDYSDYDFPGGLVVHAEGSGFKAHATSSSRYYNNNKYWRLTLNSSGAWTSTDVSSTWIEGGGEGSTNTDIHLDTVTKDVHLTAQVHTGALQKEIWYSKRAYSGATWPAGTNRLMMTGGTYISYVSTFDGDRTIFVVPDYTVANYTPIVLERNKADTTTINRTPPSGVSGAITIASSIAMGVTYNANKDILMTFSDVGTDASDIYKNTYTRASNTWSGATLVRDTTPNTSADGQFFIRGTKNFFFLGTGVYYFLTDMLEVAYSGGATAQAVGVLSATPTFTLSGGDIIPRPIIEIAFGTDPTSEFPEWFDISRYVMSFNIRRGRQAELDIIEPGSLSMVLDNDDRRFDPLYDAGPYYGDVLPARRVRVRAYWDGILYDVFSGYVNGWPQSYPSKQRNVVDVKAYDAMGFLSFTDLTETRPSELTGARISAFLNNANWPALQRDIADGEETLAAIVEESGTALSLVQEIAATELGRLFAAKNGDITFHGRNLSMQDLPASKGTWSDDDAGVDNNYEDIVPSFDDEKIYNRVSVTREGEGAVEQTSQDLTSQTKYFVRDLSQSGLPLLDDASALARAQFLLSQYKDPQLRFTSMDVNPRVDGSYAENLDLELGDHIVAERFVTSMITKDVMVDGINIDVNRDTKTWDYTFYLTPIPVVEDYWIAGTGVLGTSTKLGF